MRPMDNREGIEMENVPKNEEIEPSEIDFAGSVGNGILKLKNEAKVSNLRLRESRKNPEW